MLRNNKLPLDITKNANQKYLAKRKDVIKVIKQTNNKLHFHSQTFSPSSNVAFGVTQTI